MITCDQRDKITLGPDVPGLRKVPASVGPLRCPECGGQSAVLSVSMRVPGDAESDAVFRLSCTACGSVWEPDPFAVNIGLGAGVLIQMARGHDERCCHNITAAQLRAYLTAHGWTELDDGPHGAFGSLWYPPTASGAATRGHRVGVPADDSFPDFTFGALERIARIEDRSVAALAADIRRAV